MHFFIEKSNNFGPKRVPKWRQNGVQNRAKIEQKTKCLPIRLQGGQKVLKWSPNGANMERKWSQNGAKMKQKWRQNEAKMEDRT